MVRKPHINKESGLVTTYVHHSNKMGSLVELLCETDVTSKSDVFIKLAKNIAMQVASMDPKDAKELEKQEFIKDPKKKIKDLVEEVKKETNENIQIGRFRRIQL